MKNIFLDRIYVSIASYRDLELGFTVYDLLSKAKYPKRVFVSIYDQDEHHIDLSGVFKRFGVTQYVHKKVHYSESTGVGKARYETQKNLSVNHKYYLQIDSHTRFEEHWDEKLINDYEEHIPFWGNYIMSTYPQEYKYDEDRNVNLLNGTKSNMLKIVKSDFEFKFKAEYNGHVESYFGEETGYFCGGFAFGYARLFPKNNKQVYFDGEEQMLSVRLFENDVTIVAPFRNYVYHDYVGEMRIRNWTKNEGWEEKQLKGRLVVVDFFSGRLKKPFGVKLDSISKFIDKFVKY